MPRRSVTWSLIWPSESVKERSVSKLFVPSEALTSDALLWVFHRLIYLSDAPIGWGDRNQAIDVFSE